jgi:hypothetical protein
MTVQSPGQVVPVSPQLHVASPHLSMGVSVQLEVPLQPRVVQ